MSLPLLIAYPAIDKTYCELTPSSSSHTTWFTKGEELDKYPRRPPKSLVGS